MNPRILVAFAAGAMAASGIVFIAMRPGSHSTAASLPPEAPHSRPAMARLEPSPAPPVLTEVSSAADLIQVEGHGASVPLATARRVTKPSPMPTPLKKWPADGPEPAVVAQNAPAVTPSPVNPAPVPAPTPDQSMPVEQSVIPPQAPAPTPLPAQQAGGPVRQPNTVTLEPGMLISIRTGQPLSTRRNQAGDSFVASLDQPLVINGWIIAARGSRAEGRVVECADAGRVNGGSQLGLQLTNINTTDGQHLAIRTSTFLKRGASWDGSDAARIGGAAAVGAAIGAIAGGGKGAGIGAVVGGAAGAGGVVYARRSGADIPVETRITFRVDQPLTITEHLN